MDKAGDNHQGKDDMSARIEGGWNLEPLTIHLEVPEHSTFLCNILEAYAKAVKIPTPTKRFAEVLLSQVRERCEPEG